MLVLLVFCFKAKSQDYCSWNFQIDFGLKSSSSIYHIDSFTVLLNEPFYSGFEKGNLVLNDNANVNSLRLKYHGDCSYEGAKTPPEFFITVFLFDKHETQHFSIMIPVTFDTLNNIEKFIAQKSINLEHNPVYLNLGNFEVSEFIFHNDQINSYVGLQVNSNGEIQKYKQGEFVFPATKRLLRISTVNKLAIIPIAPYSMNRACDITMKNNKAYELQVGETFHRTVLANGWFDIYNYGCKSRTSISNMIKSEFYLSQKNTFICYKKGKPYSGKVVETCDGYTIIGRCKKGFLDGEVFIRDQENNLIWQGVLTNQPKN